MQIVLAPRGSFLQYSYINNATGSTMQLTTKQLHRIQTITNLIERNYGKDGGVFSYKVEAVSDMGSVMLSCGNSDNLRWYETHQYCYVIISKQGGIQRYSGTMLPGLVLPATPRLCEYINPYKPRK